MRWVLPGGAVLGGTNRKGCERPVVCRPHAAVLERTRPRPAIVRCLTYLAPCLTKVGRSLPRLTKTKLFLEVLVLLVGLIGAILALLGLSRCRESDPSRAELSATPGPPPPPCVSGLG
jgi:hypothetical protein